MNRFLGNIRIAAFMIALLAAATASATDRHAGGREFQVPGVGTLMLELPPEWRDSVSLASGGMPYSIVLMPPSGSDFSVMINVLSQQGAGGRAAADRELKRKITGVGNELLKKSEEKELKLYRFVRKGRKANAGYYFNLTDRNPAPGGWKFLTQGGFDVRGATLLFSILAHEPRSIVRKQALRMLATAELR